MKTSASDQSPPTLYEFLLQADLSEYYQTFRDELKVTTAEQLKFLDERDLRQLGLSTAEQRRLRRLFQKHSSTSYLGKIRQFLMGKQTSIQDRVSEPQRPEAPGPQHLIPRSHIILDEQLGAGEFGVVRQGVWMNPQHNRVHVAVKCLSKDRLQSNALDFLAEAAIMHSISHPNIVRLFGVVHGGHDLMLVTELALFRSLLECLKEPAFASMFCPRSMTTFAIQIAEGMAYLESRRMIHRDLAARNVLVFARDLVKISDFGLSRALGVGKDYYQTNFNANLKLPIAWCAPESINFLKFTSSSDVWAFGVTLWEMFSFGAQPWQDLNGHQILTAIDEPQFRRLDRPNACPRDIYAHMMKCWAHESMQRPTFTQTISALCAAMPEQVQAKCASQAFRPETLAFAAGDLITVIDRSSPDIWKGFCQGMIGYFSPMATVPVPEKMQREDSGRKKMNGRRPQRDSNSDMTPLLRQSVTEDNQTPPATQSVAPVSLDAVIQAGGQWPVKHEYHEISDEDLSPFDAGPPLCDEVFKGFEDVDPAFQAGALTLSCRQRKDGSTSSASTVMDTRPLIKNKSPGHIVKPISPTDEQALDSAIHLAKELASRTFQQDQSQSPLVTPTRKSNGPRFFIFNSKASSQPEKKHFTEMLEQSKPIQDALPREVTDVYSALVEKGEINCDLDDSPSPTSLPNFPHNPSEHLYSNSLHSIPSPPPPLPPKAQVKTNPATLRHHRRIHPLILPGYEVTHDSNANIVSKPISKIPPTPAARLSTAHTLPRVVRSADDLADDLEQKVLKVSSRSNESLPRAQPRFGSSESLPCRSEASRLRTIDLTFRPGQLSMSDVAVDVAGREESGAKPKKKLDRHVSCEDLLEFSTDRAAAKRTQGWQQGTDSDEVHIMQKVLAVENLPSEDCLAALNIAGWDIYKAIKLAKLRLLLARGSEGTKLDDISFSETKSVLETTNWNLDQAFQAIMGFV